MKLQEPLFRRSLGYVISPDVEGEDLIAGINKCLKFDLGIAYSLCSFRFRLPCALAYRRTSSELPIMAELGGESYEQHNLYCRPGRYRPIHSGLLRT